MVSSPCQVLSQCSQVALRIIALIAHHTAHRVAPALVQEHLNQADVRLALARVQEAVAVVALELVREAVVAVAHHHAEAAAHQGVPLLVEVDVQVDVVMVVQHTVGIHAANNVQVRAVVVVICAKMSALVVMEVVNNTALAVQILALDNATFLAKDTINITLKKGR